MQTQKSFCTRASCHMRLQSRPSARHLEQRAESWARPLPMPMRPSSFSIFEGPDSRSQRRHFCDSPFHV